MDTAKVDVLSKSFKGEIVLPKDTTYEELRNTIGAQGSPAIILRPKTNEAIAQAIKFGVDNNLILSVRSGGHSVAGFSTNDGGLVIDMANFSSVEVLDKATGLVKIGTGASWGDVADTLKEYGLAISSGDTKSVGVGGLTIGGGIGWMVRKYGLAIDSLQAAELVTADGKTVRASEAEHPDLFWAIRGGGGNFGIVTYLEFTAHQENKVYAGLINFSLDDVGGLLKGWRDYMRAADENLSIIVNILPSFMGNPPVFMMMCCYASDDKTAALKVVEDLKALGSVTSEDVKEKYYAEVLEEAHPPEGIKIIVKSAFIDDLTDEVIDTIVKAREMKSDIVLQIRGLGGAITKTASDATAFGYRNSEILILSPTFLPPNATDEAALTAMQAWKSIAAHGHGAYSGFMSTATEEDIAAIYPKAIYERLTKIKQKYDPENVFKQNYNVKPKA